MQYFTFRHCRSISLFIFLLLSLQPITGVARPLSAKAKKLGEVKCPPFVADQYGKSYETTDFLRCFRDHQGAERAGYKLDPALYSNTVRGDWSGTLSSSAQYPVCEDVSLNADIDIRYVRWIGNGLFGNIGDHIIGSDYHTLPFLQSGISFSNQRLLQLRGLRFHGTDLVTSTCNGMTVSTLDEWSLEYDLEKPDSAKLEVIRNGHCHSDGTRICSLTLTGTITRKLKD